MKHYTITENFMKPCAIEMVELVLGKKEKYKISQNPLLNNIIP